MRCPYCHGPISRVRGLGQSQPQPENKKRTFYRCLLCGADLVVAQEAAAPTAKHWRPQLVLVWPRVIG